MQWLWLIAGVLASPHAFAQIALTPGQTTRFTLEGNAFRNDLYIDVPASARQLRIELQAAGGADVDLLVRHGEAFPTLGNAGVFGGVSWLFEHAHYRSMSAGASEGVTVTPRQREPLRAGQWHLAVINFAAQASQIDLVATVSNDEPGNVPLSVAFDDSAACAARDASTAAWFDSTPAAPVGGNPGTTVGEQRRNAFNRALQLIAGQLDGTGPVRILACWADLGGDANRATLASAGPTRLVLNDAALTSASWSMPPLPKTYTWYSSAGAAQLAGAEYCRYNGGPCGTADVFIQFNTAIDGAVVLGERRFHYGYDTPPIGGNGIDFIDTAMHEITHGLGFLGLINLDGEGGEPVGSKFVGYDDAYSDEVASVQGAQVRPLNRLDLAERAAALTSGQGLRWTGAEAAASTLNPLRQQPFPENLPRLYAPAPISPGSTLSHLDAGAGPQLMTPFLAGSLRTLGLARPMLDAVGWRQAAAPIPAYAMPYGGQWFDPAHTYHGIDLHRVEGTPDTYFLVLYSFDAAGQPEWYVAVGRIVDGVFLPGNDGNGNSLVRNRYVFGSPPSSVPDATVPGQIRVDFNQAERAPECNDGSGRNDPLALMTFRLGNEPELKWCLTQIVPESARPALDRTGHWYAGNDDAGWGVTALGFDTAQPGEGLFMVLYYPDVQGRPRWAMAQTDDFASGAPMPLLQVTGYCRTCPQPPNAGPNTVVGEVRLTLEAPEGSDGEIRFDVDFAGPGGGHFTRDPAAMIRIAESAPPSDD